MVINLTHIFTKSTNTCSGLKIKESPWQQRQDGQSTRRLPKIIHTLPQTHKPTHTNNACLTTSTRSCIHTFLPVHYKWLCFLYTHIYIYICQCIYVYTYIYIQCPAGWVYFIKCKRQHWPPEFTPTVSSMSDFSFVGGGQRHSYHKPASMYVTACDGISEQQKN